jgi:hypothetical protein
MLQIKANIRFTVLVSVLFLISCNQSANTSEKNDKDTVQVVATADTTSIPVYDPALDPLTVAGANGKLHHDSLGIKIYETWAKPGEFTPLHSHPDHAIYVLEGGKAMFYSRDIPGAEKGIPIELKTGEGFVNGPLSDSARNIGNTTIRLLQIDVHRPRNK